MKSAAKHKRIKRNIRHSRVRSRVFGTAEIPRLNVFKANTHIYAQVTDDNVGKTLFSANSREAKGKGKKTDIASAVGKLVAEKALGKGIKKIVFDRGGYAYHGRVKALAEAAREAGLKF